MIVFDERESDSPLVERIWRSYSEYEGPFISVAVPHWEMAITKHRGSISLTVRGPETKATPAYCPAEGEWVGIRFKVGTFMPHLPASNMVDDAVTLPEASGNSFWLHGSAWQYPDYENAEAFVEKLVREGLLVHEPGVNATLQGQLEEVSLRTAQRHFLRSTGLTCNTIRQIERARYATLLLQQGVSILDTVELAGYSDQPHLTRAMKHYIGQTPAQISSKSYPQLSFLFKTGSFS